MNVSYSMVIVTSTPEASARLEKEFYCLLFVFINKKTGVDSNLTWFSFHLFGSLKPSPSNPFLISSLHIASSLFDSPHQTQPIDLNLVTSTFVSLRPSQRSFLRFPLALSPIVSIFLLSHTHLGPPAKKKKLSFSLHFHNYFCSCCCDRLLILVFCIMWCLFIRHHLSANAVGCVTVPCSHDCNFLQRSPNSAALPPK